MKFLLFCYSTSLSCAASYLDAPVFGKYISTMPTITRKSLNTSHNFIVVGIIYTPLKMFRQVILKIDNATEQKIYMIGDVLPVGYVIQCIKKNTVIVSRQGKREILHFKR